MSSKTETDTPPKEKKSQPSSSVGDSIEGHAEDDLEEVTNARPRRARSKSFDSCRENADDDHREQNEEYNEGRKSRKEETKMRRKRRDAEMRSRNSGLGLSISVNKDVKEKTVAAKNKRIVFEEDFDADVEDGLKEADADEGEAFGEEQDDDDAVEEVKSSAAREEALSQIALVRRVAKDESELKKKKRRRRRSMVEEALENAEAKEADEKKMEEEDNASDEEENDLDDEFFAAVDSEMEGSRKRMRALRKKQKSSKPVGQHTTFVSKGQEHAAASPIRADHNIELVVLGCDGANDRNNDAEQSLRTGARLGTGPSDAALLFARSSLTRSAAGVDSGVGRGRNKSKGGKRNRGDRPGERNGWKRSRKMTYVSSRSRRQQRVGAAAFQFSSNNS